jgi:hypothetical protein
LILLHRKKRHTRGGGSLVIKAVTPSMNVCPPGDVSDAATSGLPFTLSSTSPT